MATLSITELAATTLRNRQASLADNILKHNAVLFRLLEKGQIKNANGGRTIVEPIIWAENATKKWYKGMDTWTIAEEEVIDASEWDWKQLGAFIYFTGREKIMNRGKWEAIDLVEGRIKAAMSTLKNAVGVSLFSDGTTQNEVGGLKLIVADDPTAAGTVGGIDQAANAVWRNSTESTAAVLDKTTVQGAMNALWLKTIRGKDHADLIIADNDAFTAYWESLQQIQRINTVQKGEAGFRALAFEGADVIYDENCPTDRMYFLNTDYLALRCAPDRKFAVGKTRTMTNADYDLTPIWFAGNMTCSNRKLQGVMGKLS